MYAIDRNMLEIAEEYCNSTDCSPGHARNMRLTARKMGAAGIAAGNINDAEVWHWLSSLRGKVSSLTVQAERGRALLLWRWGADRNLIPRHPRRVPSVRVKRPPVRAWTREDITTIVKRAPALGSKFKLSGCPRGLWMETWVRVGYETGLRHGDLYALRRDHFRSGGVAITASKTGRPVFRALSPETMSRVERLFALSPNRTLFAWAISRQGSFRAFREFLKRCGYTEGGAQWLRRSGATHVEQRSPGAASAFLAHSNPLLARQFYLDESQLQGACIQPPPLTLGET